jgi:Flp pilus assembly protein TadG
VGNARSVRRRSTERGSATTEFVLVMLVLVPLVFGIFHLGLYLHVRNTLIACAHEGAREQANYDSPPGAGVQEARDCITESLSAGMAQNITTDTVYVSGQEVTVVRVRAKFPAMGPWTRSLYITAEGHAVKEPTP